MSEVSDDPVETVTARLAAIETRLDAVLAGIAAVNARRLAAGRGVRCHHTYQRRAASSSDSWLPCCWWCSASCCFREA